MLLAVAGSGFATGGRSVSGAYKQPAPDSLGRGGLEGIGTFLWFRNIRHKNSVVPTSSYLRIYWPAGLLARFAWMDSNLGKGEWREMKIDGGQGDREQDDGKNCGALLLRCLSLTPEVRGGRPEVCSIIGHRSRPLE